MNPKGSKVLVSFVPTMLTEIDVLATQESRTRSDLIREACRQYLYTAKQKQVNLRTNQFFTSPSLTPVQNTEEL